MFKKIKNVAEYTVIAYTAIYATKGLLDLSVDLIHEASRRLKKK